MSRLKLNKLSQTFAFVCVAARSVFTGKACVIIEAWALVPFSSPEIGGYVSESWKARPVLVLAVASMSTAFTL